MEYKPAIRSERWQFLQPLHLVDWVEPKGQCVFDFLNAVGISLLKQICRC